jgi:FKBP-type peptidyl-prolyl cis-trans isomerase
MHHSTKLFILSIAAASIAMGQDAKVPAEAGQASQSAPMTAAPEVAPTPVPAPAYTNAQLLEEFGWLVGKRTGLAEWGFTPDEAEMITKGVLASLNGQESPYEVQKIGPAMDEFIQKKQAVILRTIREKNLAQSTKYFSDLKGVAGVIELPSGLRYQVLDAGAGDPPKATDYVKVNYTGTLIDGHVFDSSANTGKPATFQLNKVIAGWTEGLQKISKGGKIKLFVPANLAYGDDGRPGIPPGSVLVFDVELLDISPTPFDGAAAK